MTNPTGPYEGSQPPQNPYGAPQGTAQANPYAAPPQAPANPYGGSGATGAKVKKAGPATWKIYVGIFAVLGILATVFALIPSKDPGSANVGDCVHIDGDNADSAKKVACTDSSANYTVIQKYDSTSDTSKCQQYADQYPNEVALYQVGTDRYVLCLNPK